MLYFSTLGKKKEITKIKNAFNKVTHKPKNAGLIKPDVFIALLNNPQIKPTIVLIKQFNPKGPAVIKSNINPETKPVVSPKKEPLCKLINNVTINIKSGTAGSIIIFDKIDVSIIKKQKNTNKVEKKDFIIFSPLNHFPIAYQQLKHFQAWKN